LTVVVFNLMNLMTSWDSRNRPLRRIGYFETSFREVGDAYQTEQATGKQGIYIQIISLILKKLCTDQRLYTSVFLLWIFQRHRLFDNTLPKYYTHHYLNHSVVLDVLRWSYTIIYRELVRIFTNPSTTSPKSF